MKIYPTKLQENKVKQGEQFGALARYLPDFKIFLSPLIILHCTQIFLKVEMYSNFTAPSRIFVYSIYVYTDVRILR